MKALQGQLNKMHVNNIRLKVVGDLTAFDPKLQEMVAKAERQTAENTRLTLTICANYGGRWDIMQAIGKMLLQHPGATSFQEGDLAPHLAMAYAPEPDLFIRTGGEQRVSNFLLWQLAYTEMYFTETYWPAFNTAALDLAIESYRSRERRFGRTSEQLTTQVL
jgi:undecaprenyl diphosphate synthase